MRFAFARSVCCCAVLKNTPDMSLPARRAIVNGFLGKISNCRTKEIPGFCKEQGKKTPSISEGTNAAKTNNSSSGAYCVLVVLSKQNSIFQDYAGILIYYPPAPL